MSGSLNIFIKCGLVLMTPEGVPFKRREILVHNGCDTDVTHRRLKRQARGRISSAFATVEIKENLVWI